MASVLKRKYPFLKETVTDLVEELDQRMRRGERHGPVSGGVERPV